MVVEELIDRFLAYEKPLADKVELRESSFSYVYEDSPYTAIKNSGHLCRCEKFIPIHYSPRSFFIL